MTTELDRLKADLRTAELNWGHAERDLDKMERRWDEASRARDEARMSLVEARAALAALLDGLGRDDQPRREAIDKARALVASWSEP